MSKKTYQLELSQAQLVAITTHAKREIARTEQLIKETIVADLDPNYPVEKAKEMKLSTIEIWTGALEVYKDLLAKCEGSMRR